MHNSVAPARPRRVDFALSPFLVLWELTRACTLACRHCRACAIADRDPLELTTDEACQLLDELNGFDKPLIVLTGGDPAQRPDLFEIIQEARARGFQIAVTPSATPLMKKKTVARLKDAGVSRIAISIDGKDDYSHDQFRGVDGSFRISMNIVRWAKECDLQLQINTTMSLANLDQFDELSELVAACQAVLWSVFFLVPTGRASQDMQITAAECEDVLQRLARLSVKSAYDVKTTAAPHFRRVLIEHHSRRETNLIDIEPGLMIGRLRAYQSVNDGKGLMFVSHTGDIFPSGFLPIKAGNVRTDSAVEVYRYSPLFNLLRDPSRLKGKCGRCKYRSICGGSRARAYAESGDLQEADKLCAYQPELNNG